LEHFLKLSTNIQINTRQFF